MREQFPFFKAHPDLVYLDTAATSQKPQALLDSLQNYYINDNANVHRGLYKLAYDTTEAYEGVRQQVADFLHAQSAEEIIFTRGTTDSLNLVASAFGPHAVPAGGRIVVSGAEHHSNFIPWQQLAKRQQATFTVTPVHPDGTVDVPALLAAITPGTNLVAIAQVTNVAGDTLPVAEIAKKAHDVGAIVVVDGAQAVAHMAVDVQALGADFYAFSGHKIYGPTGIGALYGRADLLAKMPPIQFGGEMISEVRDQESTWADGPIKYEAGTPHIAGVIGMGAALHWFQENVDAAALQTEHELTNQLRTALTAIPDLTVYGNEDSLATVSFNLTGIHPHDVATFLDEQQIAVRAGHHCAQPLMARLGVPATVRASFGVYNNQDDVTKLVEAVQAVRRYFHGID
ncbi:cysteine desulfurase [Lacticaseibacillus zeae DSM 20178 = KCTC 3804]|uniref:cysteine desulfurase n=2 Tax=Lacticaseibacillus zeae TaxID=57037 RepID=A0A5R8M2Q7_LACZE|nr:SufS family cysteine desulfurase [Lacticaseibacillus zeae]KRK12559.1 cysteine desulfurase [Lacticaseibacillus zeae DSM 20178 = KCTC 3804]QVI33081.1 SufS family cysteine desulfurase [Lacticaseibacillus zeae]TLF43937.1 SufS family cysteine desulfurase [Lacticaseibacillus zeae]